MHIHDRLRIFMHPQQLVAMRIKRSDASKIILKKIVPCPAIDPVPGNAPDNWAPALTALSGLLRDKSWQGAKPQLVLSNHFVRYALIPWHDSLGNEVERAAFLRHNFQLAYGAAARSWDLRMSDNGMNRSALASGIEQRLLLETQKIFTHAGFKQSEMYPHLMVAMNQARLQAVHASHWFVVVEKGRLCMALIQDGQWRSVKNCACIEDIPQQILALIERESVICGIDAAGWPLLVYWPGHTGFPGIEATAREVQWVRPYNLASQPLEKPGHGKSAQSNPARPQNSMEIPDYELALWA